MNLTYSKEVIFFMCLSAESVLVMLPAFVAHQLVLSLRLPDQFFINSFYHSTHKCLHVRIQFDEFVG